MLLRVLLVLSMCRGGDRNYPGGKKTGPKLKMDAESIVKRQKRLESQARTAQRKAAAAAAVVLKEEAEAQRAELRKKRADEPMCLRRQLGSQRIADKAAVVATASAAPAAAPPLLAAGQPTLQSFFSKPKGA